MRKARQRKHAQCVTKVAVVGLRVECTALRETYRVSSQALTFICEPGPIPAFVTRSDGRVVTFDHGVILKGILLGPVRRPRSCGIDNLHWESGQARSPDIIRGTRSRAGQSEVGIAWSMRNLTSQREFAVRRRAKGRGESGNKDAGTSTGKSWSPEHLVRCLRSR
jgi:hypothetical protein